MRVYSRRSTPYFIRMAVRCINPYSVLTCLILLAAGDLRAETAWTADHVLLKLRAQHPTLDTLADPAAELPARLGLPNGFRVEESTLGRLRRLKRDTHAWDLTRYLKLHLPPGTSVDEVVRLLADHPLVEYAEPDHTGEGGATVPADTYFYRQWHHYNTNASPHGGRADIHTPEAWDLTIGSSNVIVAVLDTGLRTNLAEFAGRTVPGYDFVNGDSDPYDDHGHGTAVAGALAASANTAVVAGVDWQCRLMPIKVLDSNNNGLYANWADGIEWAVEHGAKVINLSAGGSSSDVTLSNAVMSAVSSGAVFVTITHNFFTTPMRFPGRMRSAITVGATREDDAKTGFSMYGPEIDLVAPGTNVWTVSTSGSQTFWWGTSFAAPQVAGVAALLAGWFPDIRQEVVEALLCAGAEDGIGDSLDTPGFDNYYGWGRLNAFHTLLLASTVVSNLEAPSGSDLSFAWPSPSNASNKQPYLVQRALTPTSVWQTAAGTFHYQDAQTAWSAADVNPSQAVYRVSIRH